MGNNISKKYKTHKDAIIITCFFNPQHSEYRNIVFNKYYNTIKHLNYRIIECIIGNDEPQLPIDDPYITRIYTENLLFHKESLLNILIKNLSSEYKYVFWIDADVIFTNKNWIKDAVKVLQKNNIVQLFEYAIHLNKDEERIPFNINNIKYYYKNKNKYQLKIWRSFASNVKKSEIKSEVYDIHGHVGFAWGAKINVLLKILLYEKALIGGADHIMAHACIGQIPHKCITDVYSNDIENINEWSHNFYYLMQGKLGYVKGVLYHLWHGDLEKREYYKRIKDFTPMSKNITKKDINGLYITKDINIKKYMYNYYSKREVNCNIDLYFDIEDDENCEKSNSENSNSENSFTDIPIFS